MAVTYSGARLTRPPDPVTRRVSDATVDDKASRANTLQSWLASATELLLYHFLEPDGLVTTAVQAEALGVRLGRGRRDPRVSGEAAPAAAAIRLCSYRSGSRIVAFCNGPRP
jgi:hypothetical protein